MISPITLSDLRQGLDADDAKQIVEQLARTGCAKVRLSASGGDVVRHLHTEMERFFTADETTKKRHACPNFHFGFRPFGRQYSIVPERPDLNESFAYWSDDPRLIPCHEMIAPFTSALHAYWQMVLALSDGVMRAIAVKFSYPHRLDLRRASYIETNWYFSGETRDLLQDRHEDGHLLTIGRADDRGLEIEVDGVMHPMEFGTDELLVMPGSLLTSMTGGWLAPLYHQVRNHQLPRRSAILYLVNPPFDEPTEPFVVNESNRGVDIAALARKYGEQAFGLPEAPIIHG